MKYNLLKTVGVIILTIFISNTAIAECIWDPNPITYYEALNKCKSGYYMPTKNGLRSSTYINSCPSNFSRDTWLYGGWILRYQSISRDNRYKDRNTLLKSQEKFASVCIR